MKAIHKTDKSVILTILGMAVMIIAVAVKAATSSMIAAAVIHIAWVKVFNVNKLPFPSITFHTINNFFIVISNFAYTQEIVELVKLRNILTKALIELDISPDGLKNRWGLLDEFDFFKSELQNFVIVDGNKRNVPWYDTKDLVNYLRPILDDGKVDH